MDESKLELFFNKNYKLLFLIPIILLIISSIIIGTKYLNTGSPFERDISLKGGITLTLSGNFNVDVNDLNEKLEIQFNRDIIIRELTDFTTRQQAGIVIEVETFDDESSEDQIKQIKDFLENYLSAPLTENNFSSEETGSSLGESFFNQLLLALLLALVFMSIVVFISFRSIIPSIAVVLAAITDLFITLAILNIFGMKISAAGVAAFLLVLGYSIDTDILMTTKILKRKSEGRLFERFVSSAKTGLTMTSTTIAALIIAFFVSNSIILKEMFLIIIIALMVDVISTYLGNASLLKWYCEKKRIV